MVVCPSSYQPWDLRQFLGSSATTTRTSGSLHAAPVCCTTDVRALPGDDVRHEQAYPMMRCMRLVASLLREGRTLLPLDPANAPRPAGGPRSGDTLDGAAILPEFVRLERYDADRELREGCRGGSLDCSKAAALWGEDGPSTGASTSRRRGVGEFAGGGMRRTRTPMCLPGLSGTGSSIDLARRTFSTASARWATLVDRRRGGSACERRRAAACCF
jgi:hypothetical protein